MLELITKCMDLPGLSSPWACGACKTGLAKVKKNTARIGNVELRIDTLKAEVAAQKETNQTLKEKFNNMEKKINNDAEKEKNASGEKILEEVTDRASWERNVVMHCSEDPQAESDEQAKQSDLDGIKDLFMELGLRDMDPRDVLLGWRRLGKKDGEASRPLLLVFISKSDRDKLLDRAPRLSRNPEEYYKNISIFPDLTFKQRKMEKQLFEQTERNNLTRSDEQVSKNLANKVIGKRGERVLRLEELRTDEEGEGSGERPQAGVGHERGVQQAAEEPRVHTGGQQSAAQGGQIREEVNRQNLQNNGGHRRSILNKLLKFKA